MRLSFAEHCESIWADMDKSINAMAQIITKSQSKPMGSRLTVFNLICDWKSHDIIWFSKMQ